MKNNIIFVFLCTIYLLALFLNQKIIWGFYLLLIVFIIVSRQKFIYQPVIVLITLFLPLIWTMLFSSEYSIYSNIQGLFYLSVPVIMVILGYQIHRVLSLRQFLIYVVYIGTLLSLFYIAIVIYKVGLNAFLSPYEKARLVVGSGSPSSILCLVISSYSIKYGYRIFHYKFERILIIIINFLAIYLFASRTYWVVFIIFLLLFNYKTILKHQILYFFIVCIGLVLFIIYYDSFVGEVPTAKNLIMKMISSFSELEFNSFKTFRDINVHYRGYESYRAFITYLDGNPLNLLFGNGLGKQIDLKTTILLGDSYWSSVPWIHNGYFFVLVKEGLAGLVFLIIFFYKVLEKGLENIKKEHMNMKFMGLMIIGCTVSLILSNYVICSMFTIEMTIFLITIGVMIQAININNFSES